jgi:ectoine hydroxylase-related dioxygenase (phytanoyl-CoA dioxygenase family)
MKKEDGLSREAFDEVAYVEHYDDVRAAVADGEIESGWWHYHHHGREEGRRPFFVEGYFDEAFYLRAYPIVAADLRAGLADTPREHYLRWGMARGFLPYYQGPRPDNAAALPSPFGGLWPDQANARDIVAGKLEIGQITEAQAALLDHWIENGYVVLERAIPHDLIDAAAADLDRAFAGGMPGVRFECHKVAPGLVEWQQEIAAHAAKVIDMHHFSPAARTLMFARPLSDFLGLIFESRAFASQTLGFIRGSGQEGHQDSAYVPYSIPRQFAASWIALEDVTIGAGELFYYPGSHRFNDFLYGDRYKSLVEAGRCGYTVQRDEVERHVQRLEKTARRRGIEKIVLAAKKGDVLVWHADLVHGGNPVSADLTRKSLVTHYCPKRTSPLFSEHMAIDLYEHEGHLFTTQHYAKADFVP